jgi:hypothetical protein
MPTTSAPRIKNVNFLEALEHIGKTLFIHEGNGWNGQELTHWEALLDEINFIADAGIATERHREYIRLKKALAILFYLLVYGRITASCPDKNSAIYQIPPQNWKHDPRDIKTFLKKAGTIPIIAEAVLVAKNNVKADYKGKWRNVPVKELSIPLAALKSALTAEKYKWRPLVDEDQKKVLVKPGDTIISFIEARRLLYNSIYPAPNEEELYFWIDNGDLTALYNNTPDQYGEIALTAGKGNLFGLYFFEKDITAFHPPYRYIYLSDVIAKWERIYRQSPEDSINLLLAEYERGGLQVFPRGLHLPVGEYAEKHPIGQSNQQIIKDGDGMTFEQYVLAIEERHFSAYADWLPLSETLGLLVKKHSITTQAAWELLKSGIRDGKVRARGLIHQGTPRQQRIDIEPYWVDSPGVGDNKNVPQDDMLWFADIPGIPARLQDVEVNGKQATSLSVKAAASNSIQGKKRAELLKESKQILRVIVRECKEIQGKPKADYFLEVQEKLGVPLSNRIFNDAWKAIVPNTWKQGYLTKKYKKQHSLA